MENSLFAPRVLNRLKTEKAHKTEKSKSGGQNRQKFMISEAKTG